ncbi:hypothetical protein FB451DRAFT_1181534 [Mycena latifolia]|nr:hypothetical protein FB451DRAFT_1181534 [Mycena latifolia]
MVDAKALSTILSVCTNVQNLWAGRLEDDTMQSPYFPLFWRHAHLSVLAYLAAWDEELDRTYTPALSKESMGIHTGLDCWSRAESFIAKRRSGEIDALRIEMTIDEWIECVALH